MNIYIMGNVLSDSNDRDEDLEEVPAQLEKNTRQSKKYDEDLSSRDPSTKVKTRRRRGPNIKTKSKANRRY